MTPPWRSGTWLGTGLTALGASERAAMEVTEEQLGVAAGAIPDPSGPNPAAGRSTAGVDDRGPLHQGPDRRRASN